MKKKNREVMSKDELLKSAGNQMTFHSKGWGHELWIVNNEKYCGKILFIKKGKRCSWHYHEVKDETFYLQTGKLKVWLSNSDNRSEAYEKILTSGDSLHIYTGLRHQMLALEDSELFEFSTQHFDEDSKRIEKGD